MTRNTLLAFSLLLAGSAFADTRVDVLATMGQTDFPGGEGAAISELDSPFLTGNNKVGFQMSFSGIGKAFAFDGAVVFRVADFTGATLTGGEDQTGFSNTGDFCYSPSADGADALFVRTGGVVLKDGDPDPAFPGLFNSFDSRPTMTDNGTSVWVAGLSNTAGGTTTDRVLYTRTSDGVFTAVYRAGTTGTVFDGLTITPGGIGFDFDWSGNALHRIHLMTMATGSTVNDGWVVVNDIPVFKEADLAVGDPNLWQNWRSPSINNSGQFVIMGDTSAPSTADDFLANANGIQVKSASTVDGYLIGTQVSSSCEVGNTGYVAHLWGSTATNRALFLGQYDQLAASRLLIETGDTIDLDGDYVADAFVDTINTALGFSLAVGDDGSVYVSVNARDIVTQVVAERIIRIPLSRPGDIDRDGEVGSSDLSLLSIAFQSTPDSPNWEADADFDFDGEVGSNDLSILSANFLQ